MKLPSLLVLALLACSTSPLLAKASCPARPVGSLVYPWLIEDVMSGDDYGDVYVDIDGEGVPTGCRFGDTNIRDSNEKFTVCQGFMQQWHKSEANGSPQTLKEKFISYGSKHRKAERDAEKLYFQQHPDDRPDCYPAPF